MFTILPQITFAISFDDKQKTVFGVPAAAIQKTWELPQFQGFLVLHKLQFQLQNTKACLFGFSFIAGYGQDMMLVNFCNELQEKLIRKNGKDV